MLAHRTSCLGVCSSTESARNRVWHTLRDSCNYGQNRQTMYVTSRQRLSGQASQRNGVHNARSRHSGRCRHTTSPAMCSTTYKLARRHVHTMTISSQPTQSVTPPNLALRQSTPQGQLRLQRTLSANKLEKGDCMLLKQPNKRAAGVGEKTMCSKLLALLHTDRLFCTLAADLGQLASHGPTYANLDRNSIRFSCQQPAWHFQGFPFKQRVLKASDALLQPQVLLTALTQGAGSS